MNFLLQRCTGWFGILVLLGLCWAGSTAAQGSRADYERGDALVGRMRGKVFGASLVPHWIGEGDWFWYKRQDSLEDWSFVLVRSETGEQRELVDHAALASALSEATGRSEVAHRLALGALEVEQTLEVLRFSAFDRRWSFRLSDETLTDIGEAPERSREGRGGWKAPPAPGRWGAVSPDGRWHVSVREHNVFLREEGSDEQTQLCADGTQEDGYVARFYWSPDSAKLIVLRHQPGERRMVTSVESAPDDQLQPRVHRQHYPKPGDRVAIDRPHLFDVETMQRIAVDAAEAPNPYGFKELRWLSDSSAFSYEYNPRGHQAYRVIEVDAATGGARVILDEQCETFFCYSSKYFSFYRAAEDSIVWMSERSGWNHLYLVDRATGAVKNAITPGDWVVRSIDRIDDEQGVVWFWAGGNHGDQDPYFLHYCRAGLDGSGVTVLTHSVGTHTDASVSPNGRYVVATWSRVDHAPVHELRSAVDGALIVELGRADDSALREAGWRAMEPVVAAGRDGETAIYGVVVLPTNYDPALSYPVIEYIYAGPHGAFVPKAFVPVHWMAHPMAELGFIVVMIDGMGTNHRSKAFHDVCWRDLADSGFADRIAWMQAAGERYPAMDLSRVGIFGGSAGGQSAMRALLDHGDFYSAAAADCGCHDNRMDKIWWNEQWMGWPVDEHYAASSNVVDAHLLQGHLLLTVGELDPNVDPASTMQVVDALIAADKDFELIVVPGAGHGAGESPYCRRRRADFFVRHLMGVEPRWEGEAGD